MLGSKTGDGRSFYDCPVAREGVGALISRHRRGRMSQEQLAVAAGTDSKTVGAIEGGTRDARISTISRLLVVLNVPAAEIEAAMRYEVARPHTTKQTAPFKLRRREA